MMLMKLNETIKRHLSDNIVSYAIIFFFFILGISLGALTVRNLGIDIKSEVKSYIDGFVSISRTDTIQSVEILKLSLKFNFVSAILLFLMGLSYAGIVLVPLFTAFRGFCLGFTIAFLTDSLGKGGFLLSLVSILPQNLIYIPAMIIFSVCSISLAFAALKSRINRRHNEVASYFLSFGMTALLLFLFMTGGSLIESYITPLLVKLVAPYLI